MGNVPPNPRNTEVILPIGWNLISTTAVLANQAGHPRAPAAPGPLPVPQQSGQASSGYPRRRPETTALYSITDAHLDTVLELARARSDHGFGYPRFVEREFEKFLDCGIIRRGFVRVRCGNCKDERLVAQIGRAVEKLVAKHQEDAAEDDEPTSLARDQTENLATTLPNAPSWTEPPHTPRRRCAFLYGYSLHATDRDASGARLVADERGNALAIWGQSGGAKGSVWASRFRVGQGWGEPELIESNNSFHSGKMQLFAGPTEIRALWQWHLGGGIGSNTFR